MGSIALYWALLVFYILRRERLQYDIDEGMGLVSCYLLLPVLCKLFQNLYFQSSDDWNRYLLTGQVAAVGYLLHFLPYFLCERTLFLHYYLPALLFKIILIAAVTAHLEVVMSARGKLQQQKHIMLALYVALISAAAYTFLQFLPLSYGLRDLSAADVLQLKWRKTWHLLIHKQ